MHSSSCASFSVVFHRMSWFDALFFVTLSPSSSTGQPPRQIDSPHQMAVKSLTFSGTLAATPSPCTRPPTYSGGGLHPVAANLALFFLVHLKTTTTLALLSSSPRNITLVLRATIQIRLGTDEWDSGIITPNIKKTFCTQLKKCFSFMYANVLSNGCNFRESFSKVILFYL